MKRVSPPQTPGMREERQDSPEVEPPARMDDCFTFKGGRKRSKRCRRQDVSRRASDQVASQGKARSSPAAMTVAGGRPPPAVAPVPVTPVPVPAVAPLTVAVAVIASVAVAPVTVVAALPVAVFALVAPVAAAPVAVLHGALLLLLPVLRGLTSQVRPVGGFSIVERRVLEHLVVGECLQVRRGQGNAKRGKHTALGLRNLQIGQRPLALLEQGLHRRQRRQLRPRGEDDVQVRRGLGGDVRRVDVEATHSAPLRHGRHRARLRLGSGGVGGGSVGLAGALCRRLAVRPARRGSAPLLVLTLLRLQLQAQLVDLALQRRLLLSLLQLCLLQGPLAVEVRQHLQQPQVGGGAVRVRADEGDEGAGKLGVLLDHLDQLRRDAGAGDAVQRALLRLRLRLQRLHRGQRDGVDARRQVRVRQNKRAVVLHRVVGRRRRSGRHRRLALHLDGKSHDERAVQEKGVFRVRLAFEHNAPDCLGAPALKVHDLFDGAELREHAGQMLVVHLVRHVADVHRAPLLHAQRHNRHDVCQRVNEVQIL
eukprot:Rhum_TRINITY_DN12287_c0_g2::Rhum_TRINITY_DN12287_c0_g2_i1::g.50712::m.50712